jgi:hypothetical protein
MEGLKTFIGIAVQATVIILLVRHGIGSLQIGALNWRPVFGRKTFIYKRGRDVEFWVVVGADFAISAVLTISILSPLKSYF